ncbi:MAG: thioredoxin domain-containing protein [Chitinophagaceae bacterium]|nr:MAG: thioredoxin domain-containing protein [Chitinophagaceae bacterium]
MHKFTNQLIHESSPYLLQHAHNPVNWFAWCEEALHLSKKEDKPILVSIGYSACHWCHVMERESFEDEATAKIMNDFFINIKIDREERPDLDHVFMDAVQALTGSGGWPLNVFLTPQGKPFYGGTYFPPLQAFNRSSWKDVLLSIHKLFTEKRSEVETQSETLIAHLTKSNAVGLKNSGENDFFTQEQLDEAFKNITQSADKVFGGFGKAPKFPQTFVIQFLLRYYFTTQNKDPLQQALLSIDNMINGGIYDQLGGGFARYSTDAEWLAPHFEKMLYDNALLLSVISEAYQLTGNKRYADVLEETVQFIQRELTHIDGGFYAALDADSEGEEGKYYVWSYEEVQNILQNDADPFCKFYDITIGGNWEGKNILRRKKGEKDFCKENNIGEDKLQRILITGKEKLLAVRQKRVRPGLDDKILLGWNALMNTALCKVFAATQKENYRKLAVKNMDFLLQHFSKNYSNEFSHTWKNGKASQPAFLDDYAFLIQALIHLQEITSNSTYLIKAKAIAEFVLENFKVDEGCFFYYTHKNQKDIIVRKKEIYDGAIPSGNSIMADNLYRLSLYFDIPEWKNSSINNVKALIQTVTNYPSSFGIWACLMQELVNGTNEIVIVSEKSEELRDSVLKNYIPHKIMICGNGNNNLFPILAGKIAEQEGSIFLCKDNTCKRPVATAEQLMSLIRNKGEN